MRKFRIRSPLELFEMERACLIFHMYAKEEGRHKSYAIFL
jgi:hypothetical protein